MRSEMKQVVLRHFPGAVPRADDFAVATVARPAAGDGEVLVETHWLSLDPLIRFAIEEQQLTGRARVLPGEVMYGGAVGRVVASRAEGYRPGDWVEGRTGWREYAAVDPAQVPLRRLDPAAGPLSAAVGMLGMPGQTAHACMIEVGRVQAGETVVISAAAGAVGTVAAQIGRILGARVVGVAGGPEKCRRLEELGFDAAVDYKAADYPQQLAAACPGGIHVYVENVGGAVTEAVLPLLRYGARMPVCGFIAYYGFGREGPGPDRLPGFMRTVMSKGLEVRGFGGTMVAGQAALDDLHRWHAEGRLVPVETVVEGLEQAPAAFAGIFGGNANVGKLLVKVR